MSYVDDEIEKRVEAIFSVVNLLLAALGSILFISMVVLAILQILILIQKSLVML